MRIDLEEEKREIDRIEFDDHPDQEAEHRVHKATELALGAVRLIADELVGTPEEEDLVEFQVAERILQRHSGKLSSRVLRQRLMRRSGRSEECGSGSYFG